MSKLNALNWQYMYKKKDAIIAAAAGDDQNQTINDWDCIIIQMQENAMKTDPKAISKFFLPSSQINVNLAKTTVTPAKGKEKPLIKAKTNDRFERNRPTPLHKDSTFEMFALTIETVERHQELQSNKRMSITMTQEAHAYGNMWCKKVKKRSHLDEECYPTPVEMVEGIQMWLIE